MGERSDRTLKSKDQASSGNNVAGLADEEGDDDSNDEGEEEQCRRNYEEVLGAAMRVDPQAFLQCLPGCIEKMKAWFAVTHHRVLALYLACDLLEYLKEHS